ncbi:hypothetical protein NG791_18210, partial [Laspinema sp. D1]|uniref:WD40 repeat domain-containing protein n=1 Tax=Laspinema palackyanum TaxID=3231601 RepID=UPI0034961D0A|nr:hypothetical protein [Laspinema sp. D2b]
GGQMIAELKGHQGEVISASFSPDGESILTASDDNTARVWDRGGQMIAELKGHQGEVISASFSPDGESILTASDDNTARVWDRGGQMIAELKGHQGEVISASFSPDGESIVTASNDNTARVWPVGSLDKLLEWGCDWLADYLATRPRELDNLETCQTPSNLAEAAPFLVKEGEEEARGGQVDAAVTTFRKALKWSNGGLDFEPEAKAQQLAEASERVKKGEELAEQGQGQAAVREFQEALNLDPSLNFQPQKEAASLLVSRGETLVREGKVKEAISAYADAQTLAPTVIISRDSWNTLCWHGSLHGSPQSVMFACEKAVELSFNDPRYRGNRGLARALTGNSQGAIEDFQAYIDWSGGSDEQLQIQGWIDALKAGKNPFTEEELDRLRQLSR